jgi:hypothetical protein
VLILSDKVLEANITITKQQAKYINPRHSSISCVVFLELNCRSAE